MKRVLVGLVLAAPLAVHAQCGQIAQADVIGKASAALPFAQQSGYGVSRPAAEGPRKDVGRPCQHGVRRQCRMFRVGNREHPREREPRTDLVCVVHGLWAARQVDQDGHGLGSQLGQRRRDRIDPDEGQVPGVELALAVRAVRRRAPEIKD